MSQSSLLWRTPSPRTELGQIVLELCSTKDPSYYIFYLFFDFPVYASHRLETVHDAGHLPHVPEQQPVPSCWQSSCWSSCWWSCGFSFNGNEHDYNHIVWSLLQIWLLPSRQFHSIRTKNSSVSQVVVLNPEQQSIKTYHKSIRMISFTFFNPLLFFNQRLIFLKHFSDSKFLRVMVSWIKSIDGEPSDYST